MQPDDQASVVPRAPSRFSRQDRQSRSANRNFAHKTVVKMPWNDIRFRIAVLTAAFCSAATALYALTGTEPSVSVTLLILFGPSLSVILWMQKDACATKTGAVHDLGFFLFLAWPVVLPWYVFKSRGRRGWKLLIALAALMMAPQVTDAVLYTCFPGLYY
jgi:hypothetical protein